MEKGYTFSDDVVTGTTKDFQIYLALNWFDAILRGHSIYKVYRYEHVFVRIFGSHVLIMVLQTSKHQELSEVGGIAHFF